MQLFVTSEGEKIVTPYDDVPPGKLVVPVMSAVRATYFGEGGTSYELGLIQLDASERPDVADLARIMHTDPPETWGAAHPPPVYLFDPPGEIVRLEFTDPVSCVFAFFVPWEGNSEFFETAIETGNVGITFGSGTRTTGEVIFFHVNAGELAKYVQMWQSAEEEA